jgi:HEAT repeat protein
MGKKRGILLAVLLVALAGGVVWMLFRPAEPAYQGKSVSAWLNEFNGVPVDTTQAAFVAFREMGTNAIPALLRVVQSYDSPFNRMILEPDRMQTLVHFPLVEKWHQRASERSQQRWAATFALYAMGTNAKPALPALTNLLFHTNTQFFSGALAGMGPEGLSAMIAALTNQNADIRLSAATGLMWGRSDLNLVVPALIARLSDQDSGVHRTAVLVLGQLHAEPGLAVPALMEDFPGKDPELRSLILEALGRFETNGKAAVPMFLETLSDNDQAVRDDAASALKRIDPAAAAKAGVK